jgi:beta,beta-carotene 9',10'-dioxygenase
VTRYSSGVRSLHCEIENALLPLQGTVPDWLSGSLIRNGPALFEVGGQTFNHWFDGLSALHQFTFADRQVTYSCKFLQSEAYKRTRINGRISSVEFGTRRKMNLIERLRDVFQPELSDNANVNVVSLAGCWVALTETPHMTEFEAGSLKTVGGYKFDDRLKFHVTTAHPHFDFSEGALYNVVVAFGKTSTYGLVKQVAGEQKRTLLGRIETPEPGYMHSFAMTRRFVILTEFPLRLKPTELIFAGKPYIECYHWQRDRPTNFIVVSKENGAVVRRFEVEAGFSFHHINAYERGDDVLVDLVVYPDAQIVQALYLTNLQNNGPVPVGEGRRFRLNLKSGSVNCEILAEGGLEFPQINYKNCSSRQYSYCYGAGANSGGDAAKADNGAGGDFLNDLRKINIETREVTIWKQAACYPGEPIFVPRPGGDAGREDDGVLLSLVLNGDEEVSFLLVLDSGSMQEMARLTLPQLTPFTFHGVFTGGL